MLAERTPHDVHIWADSGFQGSGDKHPNVHVPRRGTKKRPLSEAEREENHTIASFRVVAEHAIGGLKRFRVMRDTLRNKIGFFDDRVSRVCAGLWNLDLRYG